MDYLLFIYFHLHLYLISDIEFVKQFYPHPRPASVLAGSKSEKSKIPNPNTRFILFSFLCNCSNETSLTILFIKSEKLWEGSSQIDKSVAFSFKSKHIIVKQEENDEISLILNNGTRKYLTTSDPRAESSSSSSECRLESSVIRSARPGQWEINSPHTFKITSLTLKHDGRNILQTSFKSAIVTLCSIGKMRSYHGHWGSGLRGTRTWSIIFIFSLSSSVPAFPTIFFPFFCWKTNCWPPSLSPLLATWR